MTMKHNVFVYGTLLRGFGNHRLLENAFMMGETSTEHDVYKMISVGYFPGVLIGGTDKIVGEMYAVDDSTFAMLDSLEGFPSMYSRIQVPLENGFRAWMYIWNKDFENCPIVPGGNWRTYESPTTTSDWDDSPEWDDSNLDDLPKSHCDVCDEPFDSSENVMTDGPWTAHQDCLNQLFV